MSANSEILRIPRPYLVWAVLAVNTAVFVAVRYWSLNSGGEAAFFQLSLFWGLSLHEFWAYARAWQPLTALFLHYELINFLFLMITLWALGGPLESSLGRGRFALLYLASGLTGQFVFLLASMQTPELEREPFYSAAPAVYGLLGSLAACYPRGRLLFFIAPVPVWGAAALFVAVSFLFYLAGAMPLATSAALILSLGAGALYTRYGLGVEFGGGASGPDALRIPGPKASSVVEMPGSRPAGERAIFETLRGASAPAENAARPAELGPAEARRIAMEQARRAIPPSGSSPSAEAPSESGNEPGAAPRERTTAAEGFAKDQDLAGRESTAEQTQQPESLAEKPATDAGESARLRYDPKTGRFYSQ